MSKKLKNNDIRYEVITQEDPESGDVLLPIPPILLAEMGWKEGDDVEFNVDDIGRLIIKKKNNN
jgi:hypothetical protein